jgi:tetratricopeptide (TPR) repeat protein
MLDAARRLAAGMILAVSLAACLSPQAGLLLGLLPEDTFATLLTNLRGVSEPNREKLAALERRGDWRGIAEFAQAERRRDPHNADWWLVSGYAYSQLGEYQRAADEFQQAVRLGPEDITAWNLLAQSQRSLGQPERAVRTLEAALRVSQDSAMTWYLLGESYSDLKRPERAVGYYERAVEREPKFAEAVYGLGVAYARLGRKREFDATLRYLQKLDPPAAEKLAATPLAVR